MKTLDNAEYANHRVLGGKSIEAITKAMKLSASEAESLRAANDELSESAFMTKRREHWAKSNTKRAERSTRSRFTRFALVALLQRALEKLEPCECGEGLRICGLCAGVRSLGLTSSWDLENASPMLEPLIAEASEFLDNERTRFDVATTQVEDDDSDFGGP